MALYEWLGLAYFGGFSVAAWAVRVETLRRLRASLIAAVMAALVVTAVEWAPSALRAWLGHLYLVAGYWLPALLVPPSAPTRFEEWLTRRDAALRRSLPPVPPLLRDVAELGYLACYPLVPVAFLVVWFNGGDRDVDRFWSAVLLAGYACYATLPWLVSRPPRQRRSAPRRGLPTANAFVLQRVSHQFNTFPSGHVAVAVAAAIVVATVSLPAASAVALVAAAISVGAASGGYHYVIDVVLGIGIGLAGAAAAAIV